MENGKTDTSPAVVMLGEGRDSFARARNEGIYFGYNGYNGYRRFTLFFFFFYKLLNISK
jgi:hypothetical protein